MGLAIKIVLLLVFAAVAALIVFFILFFLRPIATTVRLRRRALRRAGLRKTKLTTTVGKQIVWHGGDGPLLVLLHGAGDQAGTWNKVATELKRHFQLVIPDLAGHGESDPVAGALSLGTLLTALAQVLDAMSWRCLLYTSTRSSRTKFGQRGMEGSSAASSTRRASSRSLGMRPISDTFLMGPPPMRITRVARCGYFCA